MKIFVDASVEWVVDEIDPAVSAQLGFYLRSVDHGVYLNVREEEIGKRALTTDGLQATLREQNWASPPFDEWVISSPPLAIVGGTFETLNMGGEVVLEVFVTDGRSLANFATVGERTVIAAVVPSVQRLARRLRFE